ncbi:MAG: exodeoxyribonuclease VII small subunit [Legionellales bacterium]|nr:exodeoxyribonuclease VII small subunit [Legionellales bacterium]
MTKKNIEFNFEQSLTELNTLVEELETGKLTLEQSLSAFERGIKLTRECQHTLAKAEQKVHILLEKNAELTLAPYTEAEDDKF